MKKLILTSALIFSLAGVAYASSAPSDPAPAPPPAQNWTTTNNSADPASDKVEKITKADGSVVLLKSGASMGLALEWCPCKIDFVAQ